MSRLIVLAAGLTAWTAALAAGQERPPERLIDEKTIAAYKAIGGEYHAWTLDVDGAMASDTQRPAAKIKLPGFLFAKQPTGNLPDVSVPFALAFAEADADTLDRLPTGRQLQMLGLSHARLTDASVKKLARLTSLKVLYIGWTRVGPAGLKELAPLKNLNTLHLSGASYRYHLTPGAKLNAASTAALREAGLLHVIHHAEGKDGRRPRSPAEVITLDLKYTDITDAGLKEFSGFKNLSVLSLGGTGVTDAGVKHCLQFPELTRLQLGYTDVTDAGVRHLLGLKRLESLNLDGTKVTDAGVASLRQALPKCKISNE
ncbi:MAG TPA: hypothetical protein VD866_31610 [Urbifossiella sp.]|nr:hypothetical protein [Urbifossiella sp.]